MKIIIVMLVCFFLNLQQPGTWNAPKEADKVLNPAVNDPNSVKAGSALFTKFCVMCHGAKGKGDGAAGISLVPHPGNLLSARIVQSTDGALFWKIGNGKAPMPAFKPALTDVQRWSLVNYIRELQKVNGTAK